MRRSFAVGVVILLTLLNVPVVQAGTYYEHDHPSYWWYVEKEPAFSAVIPSGVDPKTNKSGGERYTQKSIFGMEILEISFKDDTIIMEVIHQPGKDIGVVKESLKARYKPLVKDVSIIADRQITTSNSIIAHFYAYEAMGAHGKKVMLRSVFFQKGNSVVYLTMFLDADEYHGDIREYWLRAVNGFEWD